MIRESSIWEKVDQEMKHLETKYQTLTKLHYDQANNYKMLIHGVMFGLLGGLFAAILYGLLIESLSPTYQLSILILVGLTFVYFIRKFVSEMKLWRKKALQVKQERDKVFSLLNSVRPNR